MRGKRGNVSQERFKDKMRRALMQGDFISYAEWAGLTVTEHFYFCLVGILYYLRSTVRYYKGKF